MRILVALIGSLTLVDAERTTLDSHHVSIGSLGSRNNGNCVTTVHLDVSRWSSPVVVANDVTPRDDLTLMASTKTRVRGSSMVPPLDDAEPFLIPLDVSEGVTQPLVKTSIWTRLTGREFESPQAIEQLVQTGLLLTKHHDNEWVSWTATDKSAEEAILDERCSNKLLAEGGILCYLGRCKKDQDTYYGGKLPLIKTISVIPMTPLEMAELLLDSSRVTTYNKMSLGRKDLKEIEGGIGRSKIVQNLTKPPIGEKMLSTTFIHARELDEGSYLVGTRAVPCTENENETQSEYCKSEILLGFNLIVPYADSSSRVTSVTHVYSSALPGYLAAPVGVKSAINFVKDLRNLVLPR